MIVDALTGVGGIREGIGYSHVSAWGGPPP